MAKFITSHIATLKPSFGLAANRVSDSYKNAMDKRRSSSSSSGIAATKYNSFFKSTKFALRNAEDTKLPDKSFDLVTVMYAFHEAPLQGRDKILKEARRLLTTGGTLAVVDISTDYVPSASMLLGEPYVQEYQKNIHRQLGTFRGFERARYQEIVPHHLGMWTLKRSSAMA
jgi:ubiquinone/menaquinone biosynthesis C-methylase UbiE